MTRFELHLTNGEVLAQTVIPTQPLEAVRDGLGATIEAGSAINLNTPGKVVVVNSRHVLYVTVTE